MHLLHRPDNEFMGIEWGNYMSHICIDHIYSCFGMRMPFQRRINWTYQNHIIESEKMEEFHLLS